MPASRGRGRAERGARGDQGGESVELAAVAVFEVAAIDREVDAAGEEGAVTLTLRPVELDADSRPPVGFGFPAGSYRLVLADEDAVELVVGQRLALGLPFTVAPAPVIEPEDVLPAEP